MYKIYIYNIFNYFNISTLDFQKIITFLSINFDRQSYNTLNSRF